jgi:hypothetical protein
VARRWHCSDRLLRYLRTFRCIFELALLDYHSDFANDFVLDSGVSSGPSFRIIPLASVLYTGFVHSIYDLLARAVILRACSILRLMAVLQKQKHATLSRLFDFVRIHTYMHIHINIYIYNHGPPAILAQAQGSASHFCGRQ